MGTDSISLRAWSALKTMPEVLCFGEPVVPRELLHEKALNTHCQLAPATSGWHSNTLHTDPKSIAPRRAALRGAIDRRLRCERLIAAASAGAAAELSGG
jgi:hypothetical protein